jgi:hemerythrin-like metal-binding protein
MSRIRWRDEMVIDRGLIDDDHRHLIDIINRLRVRGPRERAGLADAIDVLHALKFYAETHFAREERLQRLVRYPESELQHDEHQRLVRTLDAITAKTLSADAADASDVLQELNTFLRHWLLDHIIRLDLRMKPYAHLMKREAAELPELRSIRQEPPVPVLVA